MGPTERPVDTKVVPGDQTESLFEDRHLDVWQDLRRVE